jgi:hypothetical protein
MSHTPKSLPPQLIKAMEERRLVLFFGSGVSINAGLPTSKALANLLADELEDDIKKDPNHDHQILEIKECRNDLSRLSELYSRYYDARRASIRIANELTDQEANAKKEILYPMRDLPTISEILTTNYDTLIENVLSAADVSVIYRTSDLRQSVRARLQLIKLHGTRFDPSSLVLTDTDYAQYYKSHGPLIEETKSILRKKVLAVVGYSLEDKNFASIYEEAVGDEDITNYFVGPNSTLYQELRWFTKKFTHIQMTAEEFLIALADAYRKNHYTETTASFPEVSSSTFPELEVVSDDQEPLHNPFVLYDTEALMEQRPKFLFETFVKPVEFPSILEHQHTFVEGHRGSGKSTILWRLSLKARAFDQQTNLPMWGFYIKMVPGLFTAFRRKRDLNEQFTESNEKWAQYFTHYFNLILLGGVLYNLEGAINAGVFKANDQLGKVISDIYVRLLRLKDSVNCQNLLDLRRIVEDEMDSVRNKREDLNFYTGATFITRALELLSDAITELPEKWWHILLDEYDNVYPEQQAVINVILRERHPKLRFKIAVKTLHTYLLDIDGKSLDPTDDFGYVPCDSFIWDPSLKHDYIRFLEKISNQRLATAGHGYLTIKKLLPEAVFPPENSKQTDLIRSNKPSLKRKSSSEIDTYYAGFETFCYLSSGLTRQFLELCKDAIYEAIPQTAYSRTELIPIPPRTQHHVAKVHSAILFKSYRSTKDPQKVFRLFRVLGPLFRAIAKVTANQKEYRNPLSFEVVDLDSLSQETMDVLEDAIKCRLLQFPIIPKKPHNPLSEGPAQKYSFHRLLSPIFGLSLRERYDVPIKAKFLNNIWLQPDEMLEELSKEYKAKGIKKHLDNFLPLFDSVK